MAKMTKQQATDKLEKAAGKLIDEGSKQLQTAMPKLLASTKKLADHLKANQSPELIQTQAKHLQLQMRAVAEGAVKLDQALKAIQELEKDDEFFELMADELADGLSQLTKPLESARQALAAAKKLFDQATKAQAEHAKDAKQASEEWAEAVAEVDGLCAGAAKEIALWNQWEAAANDAADKRDAKKLATLQKTKPASTSLDAVSSRSSTKPFEEWDKEFERAALPEDLRTEVARDRQAAIGPWFKAQKSAREKGEIATRVAALSVEPRDAAKALTALGLPSGAKAKVQAALDGPAATLGKTLEAIAKANKVTLTAADALAKLRREKIVD